MNLSRVSAGASARPTAPKAPPASTSTRIPTAQDLAGISETIAHMKMTAAMIRKQDTSGSSVQFSSGTQSCLTLHDPMNHSTPGLPVHHQLPEFTQTHVHRVSDASNPAISSFVIPFSSCPQSLPASEYFPMSQLFAWWPKWSKVAKVLELQL